MGLRAKSTSRYANNNVIAFTLRAIPVGLQTWCGGKFALTVQTGFDSS
jgi:hypothetical protein